MATQILLGLSDTQIGSGPYDSRPTGWWWGHVYSALKTGKLTHIEVYSNSSGTVQVGLYSAVNSSLPEDEPLLGGLQTNQTVVGGQWNNIELSSSIDLVEDSKYMLGVSSPSVSGVVVSKDVSPPEDSYFYWSYGGDLPNNSPSLLYDYYDIYAAPRKVLLRGRGYAKPEVSLVDLSLLTPKASAIISGSSLDDSEFSTVETKVYICPSDVFNSESAVEQEIESVSEVEVEFTVSLLGLNGTAYLFVETGLGQVSDPFEVTVLSNNLETTVSVVESSGLPQSLVDAVHANVGTGPSDIVTLQDVIDYCDDRSSFLVMKIWEYSIWNTLVEHVVKEVTALSSNPTVKSVFGLVVALNSGAANAEDALAKRLELVDDHSDEAGFVRAALAISSNPYSALLKMYNWSGTTGFIDINILFQEWVNL